MKLYRFTASNTQRAIHIVHQALGPDALVYSTRKVSDGIEVLAGHPFGTENANDMTEFPSAQTVTVEKNLPEPKSHAAAAPAASLDHVVIESLKLQIQVMNESIQSLTNHISSMHQLMTDNFLKKKKSKWKFLTMLLKKKPKEGIYDKPHVPN